MMDTDNVLTYLKEAKKQNVKEIYFTGGEPFLHEDMLSILEQTLLDFPEYPFLAENKKFLVTLQFQSN